MSPNFNSETHILFLCDVPSGWEFLLHSAWGPVRVIFKYFLVVIFLFIIYSLEFRKFSPPGPSWYQGLHLARQCLSSFARPLPFLVFTKLQLMQIWINRFFATRWMQNSAEMKTKQTYSYILQYHIISTPLLVIAKIIFPGLHFFLQFLTI